MRRERRDGATTRNNLPVTSARTQVRKQSKCVYACWHKSQSLPSRGSPSTSPGRNTANKITPSSNAGHPDPHQGYREDSGSYLLCLQKSLDVTLNHGFPHSITQETVVLAARQVPVDGVRLAVLYLHREKPLVSTVDINQPLDKEKSLLSPKAVAFQPSGKQQAGRQPNGFSLP